MKDHYPRVDDFRNYYYDIMEAKRWWPLTTFLEIIEKMPYFAYKYPHSHLASENPFFMKAFLTTASSNTTLQFTSKTCLRRVLTSSSARSKENNRLKALSIPIQTCNSTSIKASHLHLWRYPYPRSNLGAYIQDKQNNRT